MEVEVNGVAEQTAGISYRGSKRLINALKTDKDSSVLFLSPTWKRMQVRGT